MPELLKGPQLGEFSDPRITQRRLAVAPSGEGVWVDITGDDRLAAIDKLPGRWPEILKARERGLSLDEIISKIQPRCPPPCKPACVVSEVVSDDGYPVWDHQGPDCLSFLVSSCYNIVETYLQDFAAMKAKWL